MRIIALIVFSGTCFDSEQLEKPSVHPALAALPVSPSEGRAIDEFGGLLDRQSRRQARFAHVDRRRIRAESVGFTPVRMVAHHRDDGEKRLRTGQMLASINPFGASPVSKPVRGYSSCFGRQ